MISDFWVKESRNYWVLSYTIEPSIKTIELDDKAKYQSLRTEQRSSHTAQHNASSAWAMGCDKTPQYLLLLLGSFVFAGTEAASTWLEKKLNRANNSSIISQNKKSSELTKKTYIYLKLSW